MSQDNSLQFFQEWSKSFIIVNHSQMMQCFLQRMKSHDSMFQSHDSHVTHHKLLRHSGTELVANQRQDHIIFILRYVHITLRERERGWEGGREREREGERVEGREGERERERERGREGGRGGRERGREGGRGGKGRWDH